MATPDSILAAYPSCALAIAWTETFICRPPDPGEESSWEIMMAAVPPMTLDEVAECLLRAIEDQLVGRAPEARQQMHDPAFRTYLAGKMGMMM